MQINLGDASGDDDDVCRYMYTCFHGDAVAFGIDHATDLGQIADPLCEEFDGGRFHQESVEALRVLHTFDAFHVALGERAGIAGRRRSIDGFHKLPHPLVVGDLGVLRAVHSKSQSIDWRRYYNT